MPVKQFLFLCSTSEPKEWLPDFRPMKMFRMCIYVPCKFKLFLVRLFEKKIRHNFSIFLLKQLFPFVIDICELL